MKDWILGQVVHLDKGCKEGIKGGKRLSAGPFVLHNAQKVHHLVAEGGKMAGGRGGDLPRDAAQALLDQLLQAPAGAVAGEHGQVVEMQGRRPVGVGHLLVVDLTEPVVGGDGAGVGQDQAAHGIGDGGIFLDAPIVDLQIIVHQILIVQQGGAHIADLFPLLAVKDIGLAHIGIACLGKDLLRAVLDVLHGDEIVLDLVFKVCGDPQGQHIDHAGVILLLQGVERLGQGRADLADVKFCDLSVALYDSVHDCSSDFLFEFFIH